MKYLGFFILALFLSHPLAATTGDAAPFDDSTVTLPSLTIEKKPESSPEPSPAESATEIRDEFIHWSTHKNIAGLPAALDALDKRRNELNSKKAYSTADITYAATALRTLAGYYVKILNTNPDEARNLMLYINESLKPLIAEFHPEAPYKVNNSENNLYNARQQALRSFFIGLKRLKKFFPELQELDERVDRVIDERSPTVQP